MKKIYMVLMSALIASTITLQAYQFKVINLAPDNYNKPMSAWPVEEGASKSLVASLLPFGAESAINVPSSSVNKVVFAKAGNLFTQANQPVFMDATKTVADRTAHVLSHGAMPSNTVVFANSATGIPSGAKVVTPIPSSGAEMAIVPEAANIPGSLINNLPMKVIKKSEIVSHFTDWAAKMRVLYSDVYPMSVGKKSSYEAVRDYANTVKNYLASIGIKTTAFDALLTGINKWLSKPAGVR